MVLSRGVSVLLGNGNGIFGFAIKSPAGGSVTALAVADFNRDKKLDVAALVTNELSTRLVILLGNGDGSFSLGQTYSVAAPIAIASGDLNGDGIPDLVVGAKEGSSFASEVLVLLGNGDGTFQSPIMINAGNGISSIAVADFNLEVPIQ